MMVLSCNWFFRRGVIMMAVSTRSLIRLALGDGGEREQRDLKTRREALWETQAWLCLLTDHLTELESERETLVGITYNPEPSIFQSSFFLGGPALSNTSLSTCLVYLDGLGPINTLRISLHPCCSYRALCHSCHPCPLEVSRRWQVTMPTAADRVNLSRVVFNLSGLSVNYSHIHRALKWGRADSTWHWSFREMIPQQCARSLSIILNILNSSPLDAC